MKKLLLLTILFAGTVSAHNWPAQFVDPASPIFGPLAAGSCNSPSSCMQHKLADRANAEAVETFCVTWPPQLQVCGMDDGDYVEVHRGEYANSGGSNGYYVGEHHFIFRKLNDPDLGGDYFQLIASHEISASTCGSEHNYPWQTPWYGGNNW